MKRVAVVGAGSSGLAAIKALKEEDIDAVCFERTGRVAGLWNYHEDDVDGQASVMKSTVINSSKEISSFSDFPPPKEFPNFMHNRKMLKYLLMYAEAFSLLDHIRYHHEVISVVPSDDYDETGKWMVTTKHTHEQTVKAEVFDGVMVCTGHHGFPHTPKFPGLDDFKGKMIHTHSLKVPDAFKDLKVLVVGIGNSGLDAAVDISNVSKEVYLSTRRGSWIMFRLGNKGLPTDLELLTRKFAFLRTLCGWTISNIYLERILNGKFDHSTYNLKPKHRFNAQHLAVNDHLPNKILSGTIMVKGDIEKFTEKGVIFRGEETVTRVDAVVLATGYKVKFPFLTENILKTTNNQVDLFKYVFPPHLKHPTLAIIGLVQPFGPLFPIFESQSRWFALLLNKRVSLPSHKIMLEDIKSKRNELAKRYVNSPRHTVQVDFVPYMDELAAQFGAKPNLMKIFLKDPKLFWHCFFGPCLPYQYRLEGPHHWPGARDIIVSYQNRVTAPLQTRVQTDRTNYLSDIAVIWFVSLLMLIGAIYFVFYFNVF